MRAKKDDVTEIPILPRFPSTAFDVLVSFDDDTAEIIKVMARGKVAAIVTATYTMTKWPDEKIAKITGLEV